MCRDPSSGIFEGEGLNAICEAVQLQVHIIIVESSMRLLTRFHVHFMCAITILNFIIVNLLCEDDGLLELPE